MGNRISQIAFFCAVILAASIVAFAQGPIINPSFENNLDGWATYSYSPSSSADPAEPTVGCTGDSGCHFDLLTPQGAPDGNLVCGMQSYGSTANGGVCQTFPWSGGPATISVDAHALSAAYDDQYHDTGCRVRMGLVAWETQDREQVSHWVEFPWGEGWNTRTITVPGAGTYTLFIESYQPSADTYMTTLWDNVQFSAQTPVAITSGPSVRTNFADPEASVIVTWTTDLPSTSTVRYGTTTNYGSTQTSADLTTDHSVTITGLSHSTAYHFLAKSTATNHIAAISDDYTFHTPIWLDGVSAVVAPDNQSVDVYWHTDVASTSQVEYWVEAWPDPLVTDEDQQLCTDHHVVITDFSPGSYYCFRAWSRSTGYTDAASAVGRFLVPSDLSTSLRNGDFESALYPWVQYTYPTPGFNPIDGVVGPYPKDAEAGWYGDVRAYDGSYFLGAGTPWGYKNGGVFQQVSVIPGQYYTVSARYLTCRVGGQDGYDLVRIGLDPDGGTDPASPSVKWWSGYSDTNDNQWHPASVTEQAGSGAVMTVFLDFYQRYSIELHVGAIDDVVLSQPQSVSIGALKASTNDLSAILQDKVVTYVNPTPVSYGTDQYVQAYVEEDNRTAGIEVLLPSTGSDFPVAGNKLTVIGSLVNYGKEATVTAEYWTVDHNTYDLPKAFAMSQVSMGNAAANQPALLGKIAGLCTVGLRTRVCGRVTWVRPEGMPSDAVAYIDDGSGILDGSGNKGIRVNLPYKEGTSVWTGDYISVTGVLSTKFIDPDNWPGSGDDYYTYNLLVGLPDDWDVAFSTH